MPSSCCCCHLSQRTTHPPPAAARRCSPFKLCSELDLPLQIDEITLLPGNSSRLSWFFPLQRAGLRRRQATASWTYPLRASSSDPRSAWVLTAAPGKTSRGPRTWWEIENRECETYTRGFLHEEARVTHQVEDRTAMLNMISAPDNAGADIMPIKGRMYGVRVRKIIAQEVSH